MHTEPSTLAKLAIERAEKTRKDFIFEAQRGSFEAESNEALQQRLAKRVHGLCSYLLHHTELDAYGILNTSLYKVIKEICTSTEPLTPEAKKVKQEQLTAFWSEIIILLPYKISESVASFLYFFQLLTFHQENLDTDEVYNEITRLLSSNEQNDEQSED